MSRIKIKIFSYEINENNCDRDVTVTKYSAGLSLSHCHNYFDKIVSLMYLHIYY